MNEFQRIKRKTSFLLPLAGFAIWGCAPKSPAADAGILPDASTAYDGGDATGRDAGTPTSDAGGRADAGPLPDGGNIPACSPPAAPTWQSSTLQSEGGFKPRADVAFRADGQLRAVYSAAQSEDGWSAYGIVYEEELDDGAFASRVIVDPIIIEGMPPSVIDNEYPTLVVDEVGTAHVVFSRYVLETEQIDVFMTSGTLADGFSTPINLTDSADGDEFGASIAIDSENRVHVLFLRRRPRPEEPTRFDYSVGYLQVAGDVPTMSEEVASDARVFEGNPDQSIAVGADGSVHALFRVQATGPADGQLVYRKRTASTSAWEAPVGITDENASASDGAIAVSSDGDIYAAFALGRSAQTMHYRRYHQGAWGEATALSTATTDRGSYLGLAAGIEGDIHLVYRRGFGTQADVIYRRAVDGIFGDEIRLTSTNERDEQLVSIDVSACGEVAVVHPDNFEFLPDGVVYVSRFR